MTTSSALPRIAAWSAVASAPLAFGCLYLALAAAGFDADAVAEPAGMIHSGARGAQLVQASMVLDLFGYYLLLVPAILHLDRALRRIDAQLATLITACGLGYVLIGAIGASTLAAVCPPLMTTLERAVGTERETVEIVLRAALAAVHGGLWNSLEMFLAAVFWIGAGAMLRARSPRFAAITIALGVSALADGAGETLGLAPLASLGLNVYLVLAPLWALALGLGIARERVRTSVVEAVTV